MQTMVKCSSIRLGIGGFEKEYGGKCPSKLCFQQGYTNRWKCEEQQHAALEIQRVWRGYVTRRKIWSEGGRGFHKLAIRIQRRFRGWHGKIRAAKVFATQRAQAAALITALGRGNQGRVKARRLRATKYEKAAWTIQRQFRLRNSRKRLEQLRIACFNQRATKLQSVWRGTLSRQRSRMLVSYHSREEAVIAVLSRASKLNLSGVTSTIPPHGLYHIWHMYPSSNEAVCSAFSDSSGKISSSGFATLPVCEDLTSSARGTFWSALRSPPPSSSLNGLCGRRSTARDDDLRAVAGGKDHRPPLKAINNGAPAPSIVTLDSSVTGQSAILVDGKVGDTNDQHDNITLETTNIDADEIEHASERFFVAYAHCLLAGTGTRAGKMAKFPLVSRVTKGSAYRDRDSKGGTRRTREASYEKAIGVFEEGLRRYPKSTLLLYGASLALQAAWFTGGPGASPTPTMLEAAFSLLYRAWDCDPERRVYMEVCLSLEITTLGATKFVVDALTFADNMTIPIVVIFDKASCRGRNNLPSYPPPRRDSGELQTMEMRKFCLSKAEPFFLAAARMARNRLIQQEAECVKNNQASESDEMDPELAACRRHLSRATLHLALWSQIANGNHNMDLRRVETVFAYRRTDRLYNKAMQLATPSDIAEISSSVATFTDFYLNKASLLETRSLCVRLPPHPEDSIRQVGANDRTAASLVQAEAGVRQVSTLKRQGSLKHHCHHSSVKIWSDANTLETKVRIVVTSWRHGNKILLRTIEQPRSDLEPSIPCERGTNGAMTKKVMPTNSSVGIHEGDHCGLLEPRASWIIIHENEIKRLQEVAVEELVAGGRPRDIVEAMEIKLLVAGHFTPTVIVKPVHVAGFPWKRLCGYCGGHTIDPCIFGRQYTGTLPALTDIRYHKAAAAAAENGARVLQRAFGGLLARKKCREVCYKLLEIIKEQREYGRRLLENDVLLEKRSTAAARIQSVWKGRNNRRRFSDLKSAARRVQRFFRRLEIRWNIKRAEQIRFHGPEVSTVYEQGTIISGVPLMLSVLRCGLSFKFIGRDQDACLTHYGYCYQCEVVDILRRYNKRCIEGRSRNGLSRMMEPVNLKHHRKILEILLSRLTLIDSIQAPTSELRFQHRYKILVVERFDLEDSVMSTADDAIITWAVNESTIQCEYLNCGGVAKTPNVGPNHDVSFARLRGPGILSLKATRGRSLSDTRAMVEPAYKAYLQRAAKKAVRIKKAFDQPQILERRQEPRTGRGGKPGLILFSTRLISA